MAETPLVLDLSVVLPAYNEANRVPATIRAVSAYLAGSGMRTELLVVDDGSSDGTAAAVEELAQEGIAVRLLRHTNNRGKGAAVRTGVLESRGAAVLFSDADMSTPIADLPPLLQALAAGADVAIGSRAIDRGLVEVRQPFYREAMGRVFNVCVQGLLLPGLHDTQCGFKAFRGDAGRTLFASLESTDFDFDVEILYRARRLGMSIVEVPVRWRNSPDTRVSAVRDASAMFLALFKIRRRVGREA
ncbi:MAG: dolichyl-phosphate beta-glucosyltransferase [Candidatus Dormibacteria bacterium]